MKKESKIAEAPFHSKVMRLKLWGTLGCFWSGQAMSRPFSPIL